MAATAGGGLTPRQQKAIVALLSQPSIAKAAKSSKIPERTLHEWLRNSDFKAELNRAQGAMFEAAVVGLTKAASKAIATLVKNLTAKGLPGVQVRAAKVLLDKVIQVRGMADLQAEVAELRASMERANADAAGPQPRSGTDPEAGAASNGPAQPDTGPPAEQPAPPVRGDGVEAGPVADGIPAEHVEAGIPPLFPPSREDDGDGQPGDDGSESPPEE